MNDGHKDILFIEVQNLPIHYVTHIRKGNKNK